MKIINPWNLIWWNPFFETPLPLLPTDHQANPRDPGESFRYACIILSQTIFLNAPFSTDKTEKRATRAPLLQSLDERMKKKIRCLVEDIQEGRVYVGTGLSMRAYGQEHYKLLSDEPVSSYARSMRKI